MRNLLFDSKMHEWSFCFISTGSKHNFEINQLASTQGLPYDYKSIMHYPCTAYVRKDRGSFSIIPVNSSIPPRLLGSSIEPTEYDFLHINLVYCGGKCYI